MSGDRCGCSVQLVLNVECSVELGCWQQPRRARSAAGPMKNRRSQPTYCPSIIGSQWRFASRQRRRIAELMSPPRALPTSSHFMLIHVCAARSLVPRARLRSDPTQPRSTLFLARFFLSRRHTHPNPTALPCRAPHGAARATTQPRSTLFFLYTLFPF